MMETQPVSETLVSNSALTRLIAPEDFIAFDKYFEVIIFQNVKERACYSLPAFGFRFYLSK
jgi:hypothetical protein